MGSFTEIYLQASVLGSTWQSLEFLFLLLSSVNRPTLIRR